MIKPVLWYECMLDLQVRDDIYLRVSLTSNEKVLREDNFFIQLIRFEGIMQILLVCFHCSKVFEVERLLHLIKSIVTSGLIICRLVCFRTV